MAEKYLKGLLVFSDKELAKVHDLIKLISFFDDGTFQIDKIKNEAVLLNQYYIETRYPGDYPDFDWDEAEEAYKAAIAIKTIVLEKVS